jgi:hypothetical protein
VDDVVPLLALTVPFLIVRSIPSALESVFDFDSFDAEVQRTIVEVFEAHDIHLAHTLSDSRRCVLAESQPLGEFIFKGSLERSYTFKQHREALVRTLLHSTRELTTELQERALSQHSFTLQRRAASRLSEEQFTLSLLSKDSADSMRVLASVAMSFPEHTTSQTHAPNLNLFCVLTSHPLSLHVVSVDQPASKGQVSCLHLLNAPHSPYEKPHAPLCRPALRFLPELACVLVCDPYTERAFFVHVCSLSGRMAVLNTIQLPRCDQV